MISLITKLNTSFVCCLFIQHFKFSRYLDIFSTTKTQMTEGGNFPELWVPFWEWKDEIWKKSPDICDKNLCHSFELKPLWLTSKVMKHFPFTKIKVKIFEIFCEGEARWNFYHLFASFELPLRDDVPECFLFHCCCSLNPLLVQHHENIVSLSRFFLTLIVLT